MQLQGEGGYGLGGLKEVEVTESFLGMDRAVRRCQQADSPTPVPGLRC